MLGHMVTCLMRGRSAYALDDPQEAVLNSAATRTASHLQEALIRHGIRADAYLLESGRVAVSVARDVVVRTDGEYIWWTIQGPGRRSRPRLALYRTPHLAAERLARQLAAQPPPDEAPDRRDALPQ